VGIGDNPELWSAMVEATAIGRPGQPSEIAATCAFLASVASSFTNGQNLVVDGGYTT
jgi:3-oxoacyl-[acyl-carrier protein] reductase